MYGFDRDILLWLNQFARHSYTFDASMEVIATSNAFKGGLLTIVLLWFWFSESEDRERRRRVIIATATACVVAIVVGRLMAHFVPYRVRPVHNPLLPFTEPYGYPEGLLRGWSSFPSDHAMLFSSVATGLWFISRRVGIAAHLWTAMVILAPRVYLGMHYPTDVLAGEALGIAFGIVANAEPVRNRIARWPLSFATSYPQVFYALAFIVAMQVTTMFEAARTLVWQAVNLARPPACGPELRIGLNSCRQPSTTTPPPPSLDVRVVTSAPRPPDHADSSVPAK